MAETRFPEFVSGGKATGGSGGAIEVAAGVAGRAESRAIGRGNSYLPASVIPASRLLIALCPIPVKADADASGSAPLPVSGGVVLGFPLAIPSTAAISSATVAAPALRSELTAEFRYAKLGMALSAAPGLVKPAELLAASAANSESSGEISVSSLHGAFGGETGYCKGLNPGGCAISGVAVVCAGTEVEVAAGSPDSSPVKFAPPISGDWPPPARAAGDSGIAGMDAAVNHGVAVPR